MSAHSCPAVEAPDPLRKVEFGPGHWRGSGSGGMRGPCSLPADQLAQAAQTREAEGHVERRTTDVLAAV
jgi:hypothetical protein